MADQWHRGVGGPSEKEKIFQRGKSAQLSRNNYTIQLNLSHISTNAMTSRQMLVLICVTSKVV